MGYDYGINGYLTSQVDTTLKAFILDTNNLIHEAFGVRALITAGDGVNSDTVNVSRCVRSANTEFFSVPSMEWVPLRTSSGLDEPALETIFEKSLSVPFEYDITKYRIFRWFKVEIILG